MRRDSFPKTALLLCSLLIPGLLAAAGQAAAAESDLPIALERASAAAERSLRQGDLRTAETRYREALLDGWLLVGVLERLEGHLTEARAAVRRASLFASEGKEASQALAQAYLQVGEPAEAAAILTRLSATASDDLEIRRLLALALDASGRHEEAMATLDALTAAASDDPQLAFLIGSQYLWLQKLDAAERLFAKVIQARPIPQTHVLIGRAYRDAHEPARARRELEAALALDPSVRRAHYYLGMIALAENDKGDRLARAEAEFRQELKLAPDDPLASDQLGLLLLEAGRADEALPVLETAVRGDARASYLSDLGRCQLALQRPAEALASLRRALELAGPQGPGDEERERIHYQLGAAARALGQADEAKTHFAEAQRLHASRTQPVYANAPAGGDTAPPLLETSALSTLTPQQRGELRRHVDASLARVYFNLGVIQAQDTAVPAVERFSRAAESFEKAAEVDPAFPQVQASLGIARFNARQFDRAIEPLTRALAAAPSDGNLKRMLATAWLDTQAWEKAVTLLNDDPQLARDPSLQFGRGLALLRGGRAGEAEKVLTDLLLRGGDSTEALVLLGEARMALGRDDEAIASLERALQLKSDLPDAQAALGLAYWKLGRQEQAEGALRAAIAGSPSDLRSRLTLAEVLEATKRSDEASALLREVLATDAGSGEAHLLLGRILLGRGADAEALGHLETAARLRPDDPPSLEALGQAYRKQGRKAEAEQALEAARALRKKRGSESR